MQRNSNRFKDHAHPIQVQLQSQHNDFEPLNDETETRDRFL